MRKSKLSLKPCLSIITINFNNASGLRKTLESVRIQSYLNYEHIIIDGGSSDGSVDVIKEFLSDASYAKHLSFWCSEKDTGIYNAMNKGIRHASGKYIAILNSGDSYTAHALDDFDCFANQYDDVVLYGAISTYKSGVFKGAVCSPADQLAERMIPHPASFVSLSLYKEYGLYDETYKSSGDWELFLRFFLKKIPFVYLNKIITDYDLSGISSTNLKLVASENKRLLAQYGFWKDQSFIKKMKKKIKKLMRKE